MSPDPAEPGGPPPLGGAPTLARDKLSKTFVLVWLGQSVSEIGGALSDFAIGVWVYQQTGQLEDFALTALWANLPAIAVLPFSGALADAFDRRRLMIFADIGAGLSRLSIALVVGLGALHLWQLWLAVGIGALCTAIRGPAYVSSTSQLVPKGSLARADGLVQASRAAAHLLSPLLGALLLGAISLNGILLLDVLTFGLAVVVLLGVRFPPLAAARVERPLFADLGLGWRFTSQRPGLIGLLMLLGLTKFLFGLVTVLVTPLGLSLGNPTLLGLVLSGGGAAMLLGGTVMGIWGGPARRLRGIVTFTLLCGLFVALAGSRPSLWLLGVGMMGVLFCLPFVNGFNQAIWQVKVPHEAQGRVFALIELVGQASMTLAFVLAAPLVTTVFAPLLRRADWAGRACAALVGTGLGRPEGLLFVAAGWVLVVAAAVAVAHPRLRGVERELPDAQ